MPLNKKVKKRPFLLLEVMIAFTLVTLCAIPLIYPHVSMIKAEKVLINKVKLNHQMHLIYAGIIEKMHKNEITLQDVESKRLFNVPEDELKPLKGYKATYQFIRQKEKERNDLGFTVHLATVQLNFIPTNGSKTISYEFKIFFGSKKTILVNQEVNDEAEEEVFEDV